MNKTIRKTKFYYKLYPVVLKIPLYLKWTFCGRDRYGEEKIGPLCFNTCHFGPSSFLLLLNSDLMSK